MTVMKSQTARRFIVGWLCDMKNIQLVCVIRDHGGFVIQTTGLLPLLAHGSVAPGDGLSALFALMKSTNAQHSFMAPTGVSKFLAMGGSASVYLSDDSQSVMKLFLDDFRCFLDSEASILRELPAIFASSPLLLGDSVGASVRNSAKVAPPFLRLKELRAADGSQPSAEKPAAVLVLQPVGSTLSRAAFHACEFRAAVVRDYVNTLLILHSNNICHNDIRPSNLMLVDGGERGIVIDYGLAEHTTDVDKHAEDLVKLVLVLRYWQTGERSTFDAVEFPLDLPAYVKHLSEDWLRALTLASKCNYQGLLMALQKLVGPNSTILSRTKDSPTDETNARNKNRATLPQKMSDIEFDAEEGSKSSNGDGSVAGEGNGTSRKGKGRLVPGKKKAQQKNPKSDK